MKAQAWGKHGQESSVMVKKAEEGHLVKSALILHRVEEKKKESSVINLAY